MLFEVQCGHFPASAGSDTSTALDIVPHYGHLSSHVYHVLLRLRLPMLHTELLLGSIHGSQCQGIMSEYRHRHQFDLRLLSDVMLIRLYILHIAGLHGVEAEHEHSYKDLGHHIAWSFSNVCDASHGNKCRQS